MLTEIYSVQVQKFITRIPFNYLPDKAMDRAGWKNILHYRETLVAYTTYNTEI